MKYKAHPLRAVPAWSLPARGVWIEIFTCAAPTWNNIGRSPQGECGLKLVSREAGRAGGGSLPARGVWIEIRSYPEAGDWLGSLPARGVWIEICYTGNVHIRASRSPQGECGLKLHPPSRERQRQPRRSPQGECGLKFPHGLLHGLAVPSLPARGVWIEILTMCWTRRMEKVAPRKGSVD